MRKDIGWIVAMLIIGAAVTYTITVDRQMQDMSRRLVALEQFEHDHDMRALRHVEQVRIMDEMHRVDRQIADYRRLYYVGKLTEEDQILMESLISHWSHLNGKLEGIRGTNTYIGSWSPKWGPEPKQEGPLNPAVLEELSGEKE